MKITQFFEEVLGAKLKNRFFSWGALSNSGDRVFLRVFTDEIETDGEGQKAKVFWKEPTGSMHGYNERETHMEAIKDGAKGFVIVCERGDPDSHGNRRITDFDHETLLVLGPLSEEDRFTYARIVGTIKTRELQASGLALQASGLDEDLKPIVTSQANDPTTVQALVDARVGQGEFRAAVLKLWDYRCCVTGSSTVAAILRVAH